MRGLVRWSAAVVLLVGLGGCADGGGAPAPGGGLAGEPSATASEPTATPSPTPSDVASPTGSSAPDVLPAGSFRLDAASPEVTAGDLDLAERFVGFALQPGPETAAALRLSPAGARLGLADRLLVDLPAVSAADPVAWEIDEPEFRGWVGPFSAPATVAGRIGGTDRDPPIPNGGALTVTLGEHPHCAAPSVPRPAGLESLRQVSLQPSEATISSCLDWFTVDLFVADDGTVAAVTLDLWEP